ncbi:MAG: hypothetical protein NDI69_00230 [Bacteriovoracaceae bacterium]|nr:hypothetical protein [Bacteriovoracaceae bacterium]
MKKILFVGLLLSLNAFSQELDVHFLETQRPASEPYNIPLSINENGEVKLGRGGANHNISINATIQSTYRRSTIAYTTPVTLNDFNLYEAYRGLGWLEIKRSQVEFGAGLAALMKNTVTLGLIPYRGSIQTAIRYKESLDEKLPSFKLPKKFDELKKWREGDSGTFQTYGGIQAYVGFATGLINVATASMGIQNQFIVELKKLSQNMVTLSISEENLKRGQLLLGPFFAYGTMADFSGKRFGIEFLLNLQDSTHFELYEEALKGNVSMLQTTLSTTEQKLSWKGTDRAFYYGIPMVAGRTRMAGSYEMVEDELETQLDISGQQNDGLLRRLRNTYQYVYQTGQSMVLLWASEVNKVTKKEFEKNFFSKGRIMGVRSFDRTFAGNIAFGSVISQMGLSFSKEETELMRRMDLNMIKKLMKKRCIEERLSCRNEVKLRAIMIRLSESLHMPWKEFRANVGKLMVKEPALIYAVVHGLGLKKEVYFKFLSEKFQSLEGTGPIEL